jgi:hypothetical protein
VQYAPDGRSTVAKKRISLGATCPRLSTNTCLCFLQLVLVNKYLEGYYDAWYRFINSWIVIKVGDPNWVFDWRLEVRSSRNIVQSSFNAFVWESGIVRKDLRPSLLYIAVQLVWYCSWHESGWPWQAEVRMRKKGKGGMTDEQVIHYLSFLLIS